MYWERLYQTLIHNNQHHDRMQLQVTGNVLGQLYPRSENKLNDKITDCSDILGGGRGRNLNSPALSQHDRQPQLPWSENLLQ